MPQKLKKRFAHSKVRVINDWGLHARPSASLANLVKNYNCDVTIKKGKATADAKSIASLLGLEATKGSVLELEAQGNDADEALKEICNLFESGFGEDHKVLTGEGTNCGIVVGYAHVIFKQTDDIPHYTINKSLVEQETSRLEDAINEEVAHFKNLLNFEQTKIMKDFCNLLIGMLAEEHIAKMPNDYIKSHLVNAEWALKICLDELISQVTTSDATFLKAHANEYTQLRDRLIQRLAKVPTKKRKKLRVGSKKIILASEIGPAEVIDYHRAGYLGFVTSSGTYNSHAAILARGLNIPAIVAVDDVALMEIAEDTRLIVDSNNSELHVKPDNETLEKLKEKSKAKPKKKLQRRVSGPPRTISRDGVRIKLYANTEFIDEIDLALNNGAEGIGLFRTEFLFINRNDHPSEEEQFLYYRSIVKKNNGLPVTFRTIDLGNDKLTDLITDVSPMGNRGIRFCLINPTIFKDQLRALLRTAKYGPIKIMFPMVIHLHEFTESLRLLDEVANELDMDKKDIPEIGVMIEIPGSVFLMPEFAKHADFFAIGTNDLIQYTLAVDRNLAGVAHLVEPCHPGVVQLLKLIIQQGLQLERPVTMCGELAANPQMARLFCALGLRELSMNSSKIEEVRESLQAVNIKRYKQIAKNITNAKSAEEVKSLMEGIAH